MAKIGYSPGALFLGLGAVAAGAWLTASLPGSGALFIVDLEHLFLMALVPALLLLAVERRCSRAYRREEPASYPWTGFVFAALFGVSVALLAAANGQLRSPTRVERPVVHAWLTQQRGIPSMFGVPQSQSVAMRAKSTEAYVAVEAWWDRETELRLPVTGDQYDLARSPGVHPVELVVATGALGIEYVAEVRVTGEPAR